MLLKSCLDPALVATAVSHMALPRGKPAAAQAVVAAMASTLSVRYQPAWPIALPGASPPNMLLLNIGLSMRA